MDFLTVSIIRLISHLIILRWPFFGIIFSMYLDGQDWHLLNINTEEKFRQYRTWDKVFDIYYLALAAYVSIFWKDKIARIIAAFTYFYRTFGVLMFEITNINLFLFFFPNFFELFFIFYYVYKFLSKKEILFTGKTSLYIVLFSILIPKISQEYLFHIEKLNPLNLIDISGFFRISGLFGQLINNAVSIIIFAVMPVLALIWVLKQNK